MKQNSIQHLDLLVLDTEGYDYEIYMDVNFKTLSPTIIHFEHGLKSGTMSKKQFNEIKILLNQNDYQLFIETSNTTAYKTHVLFNPSSF